MVWGPIVDQYSESWLVANSPIPPTFYRPSPERVSASWTTDPRRVVALTARPAPVRQNHCESTETNIRAIRMFAPIATCHRGACTERVRDEVFPLKCYDHRSHVLTAV
eukprot:3992134-Pyramimonas_sp.AAC.1